MTPEQIEALKAFRARKAAEKAPPVAEEVMVEEKPVVNKEALKAFREKRKAAPVSTTEDITKGFGAGLTQGVTGALDVATGATPVGLAQSAYNSAKNIVNYLRPDTLPKEDLDLIPSYRKSAEYLTDGATEYKPKTKPGEYARTVGEFVPGVIGPGGLAKKVITNVAVPAAATETASQWVKGTPFEKYDPYIRAATGVLSGIGSGYAWDSVADLTKAGSTKSAARILATEATDPKKAIEQIKKAPDDVNLAEASLDPGLAQMQKQMAAKNPNVTAGLKEIEQVQNADRVSRLGDPNQGDTLAATAVLDKTSKAIPENVLANPEDIGSRVRDSLSAKSKKSSEAISDLYKSVDALGTLPVDSKPVREAASKLKEDLSPFAAQLTDDETRILDLAQKSHKMTFKDLVQFDSNITDAIANSKTATGKSTQATVRLGKIKDAVSKALDSTDGLNPEAAEALSKAKAARRAHGDTFETGPVEKILAEGDYKGRFKQGEGTIPSSAFPSGDNGYTTVKAILKADPDTVDALKDAAVLRLGKDVTPESLAKWKDSYGNALRAIDEAVPGFSKQFDNVAAAKAEVSTNAAKRLMGAQSVDEVRSTVGNILAAPDGKRQLDELFKAVKNDPTAIEGLRTAGVQSMLQKLSNAGIAGGENILSGAKFGKYLAANKDALTALYGKDGMERLTKLGDDLARTQAALSMQSVRTGSDTASMLAKLIKDGGDKAGDLSVGAIMTGSVYNALAMGNYTTAGLSFAGALGTQLMRSMKRAGIKNVNELVERAILDPKLAEALLAKGMSKYGKLDTTNVETLIKVLNGMSASGVNSDIAKAHGGTVSKALDIVGEVPVQKTKKLNHDVEANRLVKAAERAKKLMGKTTEVLLDTPDEMVAKALEVANRGI